jgi:hypothetical protein
LKCTGVVLPCHNSLSDRESFEVAVVRDPENDRRPFRVCSNGSASSSNSRGGEKCVEAQKRLLVWRSCTRLERPERRELRCQGISRSEVGSSSTGYSAPNQQEVARATRRVSQDGNPRTIFAMRQSEDSTDDYNCPENVIGLRTRESNSAVPRAKAGLGKLVGSRMSSVQDIGGVNCDANGRNGGDGRSG